MALPACLQPRLGLQVFGFIPPGCIGYLVDDDSCDPILREGDFAVIDVINRQPVDGTLSLIQWERGGREIVETVLRHDVRRHGSTSGTWWTGVYNRPRGRDEVQEAFKAGRVVSCMDGPYGDVEHLLEKLIGRVIGVLAPDRHSWEELVRIRDVSNCPAHILATGYRPKPPNYVEPAGSQAYRPLQQREEG